MDEIKNSPALQKSFWLMLFLIFIDLLPTAQGDGAPLARQVLAGQVQCWPHFPQCEIFHIFESPPLGISYSLVMLVLFVVGGFAGLAALNHEWRRAQIALGLLVVWKLLSHFLFQQTGQANFHYYSLPLMLIWVFLPRKLDLMRLCFVLLYSFAATVKFDSSWIEGNYFAALDMGLPLIPNSLETILTPLITNGVLLFEIFASWGLLSTVARIQRLSFWGWVAFHLYSILIVGYFYPLHCLPMLWILFAPGVVTSPLSPKLPARGLAFLGFIAVLNLAFPAIQLITGREQRWSGESYQYGLGMIDSNHQCRIAWEIFDQGDQRTDQVTYELPDAMRRCPPWQNYQRLNALCARDPKISRIAYRHDVSLNGRAFYRIVDQQNICAQSYTWLKPNDWIVTPKQGAPIVGYPAPNATRRSSLLPMKVEGSIVHQSPVPNPRLHDFGAALPWMQRLAWVLWASVGIYNLWRLYRFPRRPKKSEN